MMMGTDQFYFNTFDIILWDSLKNPAKYTRKGVFLLFEVGGWGGGIGGLLKPDLNF